MKNELEYSRRLYANVLDWYKRAETKAQVVLTIDGAFLAFLTDSMFVSQSDVQKIYGHFTVAMWTLLALMVITLLGSILGVLVCVRSRTLSDKELDDFFRNLGVDPARPESYRAEVMWFFQMIARLSPEGFVERMGRIGETFEIEALARQIQILSKNLEKKHRMVNLSFWLTGASLTSFLIAGVSYILRV